MEYGNMFKQLLHYLTPASVLKKRRLEELDRLAEIERKNREEVREKYLEWAKEHIKRWGVWKYRYVYLVRNPDRDENDESTRYKEVYSNGKMGVPNGMVAYFHISELFPYKSDEEYYNINNIRY